MPDIASPSADEGTESSQGLARLCASKIDRASTVTFVPIRRTAHTDHEVETLQGSSHHRSFYVSSSGPLGRCFREAI